MRKYYLLVFLLSTKLFAQAGTLDATYGINGKALACFDTNALVNNSLLQADGKIIVTGLKDPDTSFVSRLNTDGGLDTTFGINGIVNFFNNTTTEVNTYSYSSVLQNDGKILLVGNYNEFVGYSNLLVIRLNADGSLDTSFANNGKLNLDLGTAFDYAYTIKVQTDGKILVGGSIGSVNGGFCIVRLDTSGNLDPTFGVGGKVTTVFSIGNESSIKSIDVQTDGKIIAGGTRVNVNGTQNIALARYTTNGNLDTAFGTNGKVETVINFGISDELKNLKILSDGKIIIQGNYNIYGSINDSGNLLVKYDSNGSIDTTFGTNGIVINLAPNVGNIGYGLAIQADNKLIVSGVSNGSFIVARYLSDGSYDTSFNGNGKLETSIISSNICYSASVLIQSDNKIVASGFSDNQDQIIGCFAVIRINPGTLANEQFESAAVTVYPNPTHGFVSFDNSKSQFKKVRVYNYLGQEVMKPLDCAQGDNVTVDLSNVSNGVYVFRLEGDGISSVVKIIKE